MSLAETTYIDQDDLTSLYSLRRWPPARLPVRKVRTRTGDHVVHSVPFVRRFWSGNGDDHRWSPATTLSDTRPSTAFSDTASFRHHVHFLDNLTCINQLININNNWHYDCWTVAVDVLLKNHSHSKNSCFPIFLWYLV